jgi:hypothetical protein
LLRFAEFGEFDHLGTVFRHVSPDPDIKEGNAIASVRRLYPALIPEICRARQQSPAGSGAFIGTHP